MFTEERTIISLKGVYTFSIIDIPLKYLETEVASL